MSPKSRSTLPINALRSAFGTRLQENVRLSNYTTGRMGGMVDGMVIAQTWQELEAGVRQLWDLDVPFVILGSGSNVLVADSGLRGVVVLNRGHNVKIQAHDAQPSVWAESGANLGRIARQAALRGLSGLEWAANIPGTLGGAVYGNAGAHGGDMAGNLMLAEILHRTEGRQVWNAEQMGFSYRSSALKRTPSPVVVLTATLRLSYSTPQAVQETMEQFNERRKATQPPGASMGSMFKNPPGDYAGRLIEAAGLKGARVGGAQISPVHANFFVNDEGAKAADVMALIRTAQKAVLERFGVSLELEIELVGDFEEAAA